MPGVNKNGKAYDSGDVEIVIDGILEHGISKITYGSKQDHQINHSLNNEGHSWSRGKNNHSCSLTMDLAAVRFWEKRAGGVLPNLKPFDINVTIVNEFNEVINDTVTVKFTDQGREIGGEMNLQKEFEMLCLGIKYGS